MRSVNKWIVAAMLAAVGLIASESASARGWWGPRVGVVDGQHEVHYRQVQLGRDFGAEIEVIAGLHAGDTVVVHPGDDLVEGTTIEAVPLPK